MPTDAPLTSALGDGIVQMRLPMAGNPMRFINAYLLDDDDGATLVDCGWKADDVLAALHAALAEHGRTIGNIGRLLITHVHFDHYGLAGTLLRAGVPVLAMHPLDWATAQRHLTDPAAFDADADAWIARNGFRLRDDTFAQDLQHHRTELTAPTTLIDDGKMVGRLRAMWTPGHTPGHLCFVDRISGKMLTGDHVLDPVTPHVGVWLEEAGNPLGAYEASLERVAAANASGALPAHGEPFADIAARTAELLAHHRVREAQILAAVANSSRVIRSLRRFCIRARSLHASRRLRARGAQTWVVSASAVRRSFSSHARSTLSSHAHEMTPSGRMTTVVGKTGWSVKNAWTLPSLRSMPIGYVMPYFLR
jgi:glyoxylase-like metal-dependent hydrolase (beta-lactamase superfamily II)